DVIRCWFKAEDRNTVAQPVGDLQALRFRRGCPALVRRFTTISHETCTRHRAPRSARRMTDHSCARSSASGSVARDGEQDPAMSSTLSTKPSNGLGGHVHAPTGVKPVAGELGFDGAGKSTSPDTSNTSMRPPTSATNAYVRPPISAERSENALPCVPAGPNAK